jgi:hypothetical protein
VVWTVRWKKMEDHLGSKALHNPVWYQNGSTKSRVFAEVAPPGVWEPALTLLSAKVSATGSTSPWSYSCHRNCCRHRTARRTWVGCVHRRNRVPTCKPK